MMAEVSFTGPALVAPQQGRVRQPGLARPRRHAGGGMRATTRVACSVFLPGRQSSPAPLRSHQCSSPARGGFAERK